LYLLFRLIEQNSSLSANISSLQTSLFLAFVIGLIASISSCLAIVGSVVIAFGEKCAVEGKSSLKLALKPNIFFHVGRLVTFFILGGVLGLIGGELNLNSHFISVYSMVIAVVMAWLGLNILGLVPSISDVGFRFPSFLSKPFGQLKNSDHYLASVILGGLTFFLPCGFTQSMQIFALASGSFWSGALALFLFALGTMPMLLVLGVATSFTKAKGVDLAKKVAGILIILFAIYTFSSGLSLAGVKSSVDDSSNLTKSRPVVDEKNSSAQKSDGNWQVVEMHITNSGFSPNVLQVKKGQPVQWIIYGDQVSGCTNKIIVPSLNISQNISSGKNIVSFTPDKTGEIPFSCWMGMVRGKFVVE
jgi:sulfite exporter TauE/SafE